jgi:hypothetical protein
VDRQDVGHGTVQRRLDADLHAELDDTTESQRTSSRSPRVSYGGDATRAGLPPGVFG